MIVLQANITLAQHLPLWERYYALFTPAFQQKISRYRRWQDAQASLLGRVLLQKGLADHYNYTLNFADLQYGPQGKPFLANSDLQFNISHTQGKVICAIQRGGSVGADVEYVQAVPISDFRFQMTDNEWQLVTNAPNPQLAFYDYWTSKEAILKVESSGLSLGLKSFEVDESRRWAIVTDKKWYLRNVAVGQAYLAYVASSEPIEEIILLDCTDTI